MGIEIAGIGGIWWGLAAATVVGTSVGTSAYSESQENKRQKTLIAAQEAQTLAAEKKADSAKQLAAQEAQQTLKKQRLAQTQTILTTPLGIGTEAETARTTLG